MDICCHTGRQQNASAMAQALLHHFTQPAPIERQLHLNLRKKKPVTLSIIFRPSGQQKKNILLLPAPLCDQSVPFPYCLNQWPANSRTKLLRKYRSSCIQVRA
jgi:hypothetical protein